MEQVTLDLIPSGAKTVCHASQYDIGRTIRFNLTSKYQPVSLVGTETIVVKIKKPDGTEIEKNIANTSSTYVDWVTGEGDCDQAGSYECELKIFDGSVEIGSKNFVIMVEADPYDGEGVVTETAEGDPAVFTTNIIDLFVEIKCNINAIQEGTPWIDSNVIEKEPYNFRKVAGTASRIGNHLFDKLVGGTVAWNQLAQKLDTYSNYSMNGIDITANSDNTLTIDGTATGSLQYSITKSTITLIKDHIYFVPIPTGLTNLQYYINGVNNNFVGIFKCDYTNETNRYICIKFVGGDSFNNYKMPIIPQVFDLTAMFGSTIANYIYSLEQATAGAGVAFFRKLFPKDYYAYNAGELMSVKTSAHITRGFNAWDEETESGYINADGSYGSSATALRSKNYCPCIGGTTYMFVKPISYDVTPNICWYDETQTFIERSATSGFPLLTSPANARYFKISMWNYGATYNHDICINISDTNRNGEYEPYTEHNYALDDVELRGLFKLDSNNKLYADGDTYESSGDVGRKYGIVDLDSLKWTWNESNGWIAALDGIKPMPNNNYPMNAISTNRVVSKVENDTLVVQGSTENTIAATWQGTYIYGANRNAHPSGYLVYEKATPTTETADPFTNPQQVDANGTEEYVDNRSVAIPVGHETYYADIYDISGFTACKVSVKDGSNVEQKSATISFGQTVYDGILEHKNGAWVFTGESAVLIFDGSSDESWSNYSNSDNQYRYWISLTNCKTDANGEQRANYLQPTTGAINSGNSSIIKNNHESVSLFSDGSKVYINANGVISTDTLEVFKEYLSSNPLKLLYPLATPFTLTLTGAQLETLLGENRVSHNCNGTTEVKYLYNA